MAFSSRYFAVFLLVFSAGVMYAQTEDVVVDDPRSTYVVGFSELSTVSLPPELRYLASSLPRLIAEEFDSGTGAPLQHVLSEHERETYSRHLVEADRTAALLGVSKAVQARDQLLFDPRATDERRVTAEDAVAAAKEKLSALRAMPDDGAEILDSKPIEFWSGREIGRLLPAVALTEDFLPSPESLRTISEEANLDLLVWGTAEEIQGYLKVDFYAWSPYSGDVPLSGAGTVAQPADIAREAEFITSEIVSVLLGRDWGNVTVETDVEDAEIFVDGALAGFGSATSRYREPGQAAIDIRAQGYEGVSRTVTIPPEETVSISVQLQPIAERTARIESAPANADVYLDSVWAGQTPLELPVPATPQIVRIRADGYLESRFVLGPTSPDRIARALLPDTIVWADEIAEKRSAFYRSMTWFVLSIPITIGLNGVYQNVLSAFPPLPGDDLTPEEWARFGQLGNIFYWASAGGLMVNIGLLINAGINLFDYVDVGEGSHNQ